MLTKKENIRHLYLERLSGMFTEEDELRFQQLLANDTAARAVFAELEKEQAEIQTTHFLGDIDASAALEQVKHTLQRRKRSGRVKSWSIAATLAGLFVLGSLWMVNQRSGEEQPRQTARHSKRAATINLTLGDGSSIALSTDRSADTVTAGNFKLLTNGKTLSGTKGNTSAAMNTLTVPAKEDYMIILADGTKVWLNSASSLQFPFRFTGATREVTVSGEAYFEIAKDAAHPFIVHTGLNSIRVVGTSFNVNTYTRNQVRTSLVEGKVNLITKDGQTKALTPGYEAQYESDKGYHFVKFDQENVLSWKTGIYYFNNVPLGELDAIIARWFDIAVVFDRPILKQHLVSGLIEKGQLNDFLYDLETAAKIKYHFAGKTLHIQ